MNTVVLLSALGSIASLLVAVAAIFTAVYKRGQQEGRVTEILSQLTTMMADHETRLRTLEKARAEV